jgi:hypothetical protein
MKTLGTLLLTLLLYTQSFAASPFSLEALNGVNVTILNKQKLLSDTSVETLQKEMEAKLSKAGLQTSTKHFSNLLIKIQTQKTKETTLAHVTLSLVENAKLKRTSSVEAIAITYTKDDFFEVSNMETDLKESIFFLLDEFIDQFKEENR